MLVDVNGDAFPRKIEDESRLNTNKENKRRRVEKTIQINDRKLSALTADDVTAFQEILSDHVSIFKPLILHFFQ